MKTDAMGQTNNNLGKLVFQTFNLFTSDLSIVYSKRFMIFDSLTHNYWNELGIQLRNISPEESYKAKFHYTSLCFHHPQ